MICGAEMAWRLFSAHAIGDMALQSEWMAKHKHEPEDYWFSVLSAHAIICGACVSIATGVWWLGCLEAIWHWVTDYASTHKWISFKWDQVSHLTAKVVWFAVWWFRT